MELKRKEKATIGRAKVGGGKICPHSPTSHHYVFQTESSATHEASTRVQVSWIILLTSSPW